jgi:alpha-tubulin suppressor-like RCC1 family protein
MALLANGHVMTMGANRYGQLGVGEGILYSELPVEVPGLSEVTAIAGGGHSSYAVQNRP